VKSQATGISLVKVGQIKFTGVQLN